MAKKAKKSAENIAAQTTAPTVDTTPTVTPKLIVAQRKFNRWYVYFKGVAPQGQRRLRMQNRQKRYPLHAPAQSPLRSDDFPNHLRTPPVRGRKGGVSLSCFPCKSNPQDSRPCNANIPVTQLPANGTSMPTMT